MTTKTQNIEEKTLSIKWLMQGDRIVKFQESENTYDISDAVAEFDFERMGVVDSDGKGLPGNVVNVKVDVDEGNHGTVVYMSKSKAGGGSAPTSNPANTVVKTVQAYGLKYSGSLLFTDHEHDKDWYSCDKSIDKDTLPQYKDKAVEVEVGTTPKGKKIVKSIKFAGDSTPQTTSESQVKNDYKTTKGTDPRQLSIEAQACVNHANIAVSHLFVGKFDPNNADDAETIKRIIKSLAQHNFSVIQELKAQA